MRIFDSDFMFKKENKSFYRWAGGFFVGLPLLYFFGGGSVPNEFEGIRGLFSEWFHALLLCL